MFVVYKSTNGSCASQWSRNFPVGRWKSRSAFLRRLYLRDSRAASALQLDTNPADCSARRAPRLFLSTDLDWDQVMAGFRLINRPSPLKALVSASGSTSNDRDFKMLSAQNEPETGIYRLTAARQRHKHTPARNTTSISSIKAFFSLERCNYFDNSLYIDAQEMYDVVPSGPIDGKIIYWLVYLLIGEDALGKQVWQVYFPSGTLSFWCIFLFFYVHFEICFPPAIKHNEWRMNTILKPICPPQGFI